MSIFKSRQNPPAEKFTGVYRGQIAALEDSGGAEYKQLDGECTLLLNHDEEGNGTADVFLAGETIGKGLAAKVSSYTLTLSGVLWSSDFAFQGTICYKNRVMILNGEGILKDTGVKIQLEVIMVDEWKRP